MIKKIFGLLAAAAILALLVVTVLHRDRYRSWCFAPTAEITPAAPAATPAKAPENAAHQPEPADTLPPEAAPVIPAEMR